MPTVPIIDQTATPAPQFGAPSVTPMRNFAPQQQEALGQAEQQAGDLAMKTGATIGDRLAEQVDDARVKQAETSFLGDAHEALYGQNGYLNTLGQNAIDGLGAAKQTVVKSGQDALDSLTNPIQKQMFTQVLNHHLLTFGEQMEQHNVQQTRQFAGEAAVSRANTFTGAASNAWSSYGQTDAEGVPTGEFAKNIATAEQEILHAAFVTKGAPPDSDVAKESLVNLHTQAGVGAVQQAMDARAPYSKVQQMFDDMKSKGWLTERATETLGKMVKTYSEQESTRAVVSQNLSDAARAAAGQPTSSTGTPDYTFGIKGAIPTAQSFNPETGLAVVNVPKGSSVQAPADGKVLQVGKDDNGDLSVRIQHGDGSVTTIAGLSAANVKPGDTVQRGEDVALSGSPQGSASPVVLWSLADKNGNTVDPTKVGLAPVDITKITDEKVLAQALTSVRQQVTDPYLQQQATSEMESIVRHNQQMANAAATQTYKTASDIFYANGMNWRSIPPSVLTQLTPEQVQQFKDKQVEHVLQQYHQGQEFKEMKEVDLQSYFLQNPDMLTPANVDAARPKLANSTYLQLMGRAETLAKSPASVQDAHGINERIKYFAGNAGVNIEPKSPADKQKLIDLTYRVQQEIDQIKAQNNGKATPDQVDKAIQRELIQHSFSVGKTFFGGTQMSTPRYTFQLPAGATRTAISPADKKLHYTNDNGTVDYGVVPE